MHHPSWAITKIETTDVITKFDMEIKIGSVTTTVVTNAIKVNIGRDQRPNFNNDYRQDHDQLSNYNTQNNLCPRYYKNKQTRFCDCLNSCPVAHKTQQKNYPAFRTVRKNEGGVTKPLNSDSAVTNCIMMIPTDCTGRIIGKNGKKIKQISRESRAYIHIDTKTVYTKEFRVQISGWTISASN